MSDKFHVHADTSRFVSLASTEQPVVLRAGINRALVPVTKRALDRSRDLRTVRFDTGSKQ